MKKTISLILCLCMAFSLCACSGLKTVGSADVPPMPTRDPSLETLAPESGGEIAAEIDASTPNAAAADPYGALNSDRVIIRTAKTQESYDAPNGAIILLFSYVTPTVLMETRPEAAAAINEQLNLLDEAYIIGTETEPGKNLILEEALDSYSFAAATGADLNSVFTAARTVTSTRADGSAISFRYWTSIYNGRQTGRYAYLGLSFNSETGEKLSLDSLSADPAAFKQLLVDSVIAAARQDKSFYSQLSENHDDADAALAAVVREGNWYFSTDGIVFFPAYGELRPAEEGLPMFTVPYSALAGVMDERYLPVKREADGSFEILRLSDVQDGTVQSIDRLNVSDGEELYLKVDGTAYDVTVSTFFYVHQAQGDERFQAKDRLWYASYMTDCALQICTIVPNGMPDLMISYTDSDYVEHRLFISQSGEQNGVALVDDTIEAVG